MQPKLGDKALLQTKKKLNLFFFVKIL